MKKILLYTVPVLLVAFSVMSRTSEEQPVMLAQEEEEVIERITVDSVSDEEMELYISIYSAMQLDHSLKLEDALEPHQMTVAEFRNIERRVQNKSRLVAKVREALLEQAMQRSAFTEPMGTSAVPPPAKPKP